MAFSHGKDAKVFINGFDQTQYFKSHSYTEEVDMAETSTFGTSAKTYIVGMRDATLTLEGQYDTPNDSLLNTDLQNGNNTMNICIMPQGDTVGLAGHSFRGGQTSLETSGDTGDIVQLSVEWQSSVGRDRIISQHSISTTEVATGNGTSVDNSAQSTAGGVGHLVVTDITGITALAVKFQDSADNSAWADLAGGAFTSVTADAQAQRILVSGTVRRFLRAVWTFTGAGSATFFCGFGRY